MQTKKTETIMEESVADDKGDLRKEVYETHDAIILIIIGKKETSR